MNRTVVSQLTLDTKTNCAILQMVAERVSGIYKSLFRQKSCITVIYNSYNKMKIKINKTGFKIAIRPVL
jgi:hypothetical protein